VSGNRSRYQGKAQRDYEENPGQGYSSGIDNQKTYFLVRVPISIAREKLAWQARPGFSCSEKAYLCAWMLLAFPQM